MLAGRTCGQCGCANAARDRAAAAGSSDGPAPAAPSASDRRQADVGAGVDKDDDRIGGQSAARGAVEGLLQRSTSTSNREALDMYRRVSEY